MLWEQGGKRQLNMTLSHIPALANQKNPVAIYIEEEWQKTMPLHGEVSSSESSIICGSKQKWREKRKEKNRTEKEKEKKRKETETSFKCYDNPVLKCLTLQFQPSCF